jgi:alkanesulfonate monooxygenase SsuD/methylene tetrahydromethanopterin reductase-like flavin-dependent oxidoreductase (luciferase family)
VWGVDAWVSLAAAAMQTERIRLGTMVTPVSRCRPWKLAGETATLDRLSNGRVILSVALGAIETGFIQFGEETDRKVRAELLDEGLENLTGLWKGQPFRFDGKHYHIQELDHVPPPPPIQQPRIPIWVVGLGPRPKSMRRAARYDGLLPAIKNPDGSHAEITPKAISEMQVYLNKHLQKTGPMDIVIEGGHTLPQDRRTAIEKAAALEQAGATWWLKSMLTRPENLVESGVASGVSSAFLLLGVNTNREGTLHSIDLPVIRGIFDSVAQSVGASVHYRRQALLGAFRLPNSGTQVP